MKRSNSHTFLANFHTDVKSIKITLLMHNMNELISDTLYKNV